MVEERNKMKEIREYLIAIARTGKITISYSKLVDQLDLHYDLRDENDPNVTLEKVPEVQLSIA